MTFYFCFFSSSLVGDGWIRSCSRRRSVQRYRRHLQGSGRQDQQGREGHPALLARSKGAPSGCYRLVQRKEYDRRLRRLLDLFHLGEEPR